MIYERPNGSMCIGVVAKILAKRGRSIDEKHLFERLRKLGWLEGRKVTVLAETEGYMSEGYGAFLYPTGSTGSYSRPYLTRKGLDELQRLIPSWKPNVDVDLGIPNACKLGV